MLQIDATSLSHSIRLVVAVVVLGVPTVSLAGEEPPDRVRFDRDIRPILASACLNCHGPDAGQRQADLRLDQREDAIRPRDGYRIVAPGKPDESELVQRISSDDDSLRMPPADQPKQLTEDEIALVRRWIEEGAEYDQHWAFVIPERPTLPDVQQPEWSRNPIDHFVRAAQDEQGHAPTRPADKTTLLRRLSLDLTGLPPTPAEVDEFVADESPDAYEKRVDRLLASPRYGERMATPWLDNARYADSGGYQGDIPRTMWPWRDWVIDAFNRNLAFDQFTIEQLAGDLLPNPTSDQIIATGFNRNHRINDEDGIILEEFRVEHVMDRVETTATTWLGLTMGCARCHDHKYDPISQREFYQFFAYFNSVDEVGRGHGNAQPLYYFLPAIRPRIEEIDAKLLELGDAAQGEYEELLNLKERRRELLAVSLTTMVMRDLETPRETYVLERGQYDQPGEPVSPGVPEVLPPLPDDAPPNRLALARWIVDSQNPLTARVAVNRYWQLLFGKGLVGSPENFGTRGELPTHPELLDWLAIEFRDGRTDDGGSRAASGEKTEFVTLDEKTAQPAAADPTAEASRTPDPGAWDVKRILRLLVTSATYRQSSAVDPGKFGRDPENRWLSRGPRLRLPAEALRDQALAVAGLLDQRLGGPPVKPYQPDGLWAELVSFAPEYEQSHGRNLYRRSLYTFIRRTVPPPAMAAFDMPLRETCIAQRGRTNTPLQALVIMNDPAFVEAARVLAAEVLTQAGSQAEQQIEFAFRRVLARLPSDDERHTLVETLDLFRQRFESEPDRARQMLTVGEWPIADEHDATELASMTAVVSLIMNLDETLTRE